MTGWMSGEDFAEDFAGLVDDITEQMYGGAINHPAVAFSAGGGMCPVQYTGWLVNGVHFYFRYRGGHTSIRLGTDEDSARDAALGGYGMYWGHPLRGLFYNDAERDWVFATLLREALR